MTSKEALEYLSDGHTIWTVECAKEVCEAVGVPFSESLVEKHRSNTVTLSDSGEIKYDPKGLTMKEGHENTEGVYALSLSGYVAEKLGVDGKAESYFGRGRQAREYARQVGIKLGLLKEEVAE